MQTAIETHGEATCPQCRAVVEMNLNRAQSIKCDCGQWLRWTYRFASPLDALAACGVVLSLDWDGQLLAESKEGLSDEVKEFLFFHQRNLRQAIEDKAQRQRAVFMGGTLDGKKHGHPTVVAGHRVHVHMGRAHWETFEYRVANDPRLWFVGRSTSKAKARKGQWVKTGK